MSGFEALWMLATRRLLCEHDWGMVPVDGGLSMHGLVEHRAECLKCGRRPAYGSPEYEQCQRNHDRKVTAMLEARGE